MILREYSHRKLRLREGDERERGEEGDAKQGDSGG